MRWRAAAAVPAADDALLVLPIAQTADPGAGGTVRRRARVGCAGTQARGARRLGRRAPGGRSRARERATVRMRAHTHLRSILIFLRCRSAISASTSWCVAEAAGTDAYTAPGARCADPAAPSFSICRVPPVCGAWHKMTQPELRRTGKRTKITTPTPLFSIGCSGRNSSSARILSLHVRPPLWRPRSPGCGTRSTRC